MKIGVLGTGIVGNTIASALVKKGHEVKMGSRSANNEKAAAWAKSAGAKASTGTFADAAKFGEILFVATKGDGTLAALEAAGADAIGDKIVVDISNPLDFSKGMPPSLFVVNTDSLGEQVQKKLPNAKVVKALNTLNCELMVNPGSLKGGDHSVFMCGNDKGAKAKVAELLKSDFGWKDVIDVGDITTSRGTEQLLPLWIRLYGAFGNANFNWKIVR